MIRSVPALWRPRYKAQASTRSRGETSTKSSSRPWIRALGFYVYIYGIVILIVAVLIANTLLMAVFERFREIGILAALGMRGRQITLMFLIEAALLGLLGVLLGNILGRLGVAWLATYGIPMGDMGAVAGDMALGATLHARM